jgi:hypothetical protein
MKDLIPNDRFPGFRRALFRDLNLNRRIPPAASSVFQNQINDGDEDPDESQHTEERAVPFNGLGMVRPENIDLRR